MDEVLDVTLMDQALQVLEGQDELVDLVRVREVVQLPEVVLDEHSLVAAHASGVRDDAFSSFIPIFLRHLVINQVNEIFFANFAI